MQAAANPAAPAAASAAALAAPDPGLLLAWYDRHRRRLPWRAAPGRRQDPYRVFLSEIMLQQTTVVTVAPYYENFLRRWPTVAALAAAPLEEVLSAWAGLGYYARARNLHACARAVVEHHGGQFPSEEAALLALPGIGPYTAAAIAAIAFERRAAPVDGNWERVVSRLFAVEEPLPKARARLRALALTLLPAARYGDFAQAMMDLGATICTPRKPACALCPWQGPCSARAGGAPERYPVKAAKAARPTRQGVAFLAVRADGAVLVRSRPPKGLLGGMSEVPSTPWEPGGVIHPAAHAPVKASWTALNATVTHVFSHFALELQLWRADLPAGQPAPAGHRWVVPQGFEAEAFPSVMRKVLAHASPAPARKDYVCVNEPLRSRIVVPASRTSGSKQEMTTMGSTMDKAKGMGNEAMGNVKQGIGKATGSERLQAEGKVQELKGEAQQAKGEIKESVKKAGNL